MCPLPTFLVIGAGKCGTSTLYELLSNHPQVGMTEIKEPNFFSRDEIYGRGMQWYEDQFKHAAGKPVCGETSHTYTVSAVFPHAAQRIHQHLPDVRMIYIVRNPLERLESSWLQLRRTPPPWYGKIGSFDTAIRTLPGPMDGSKYWKQLSIYREFFDDSRILLLFLEDLKSDPDRTLRRCCSFLGIDEKPFSQLSGTTYNVSRGALADTGVLTHLRQWPGFARLRDSAPRPVRSGLSRLFKTRIHDRPKWNRDLHQWAIDQLRDDARSLLEYGGKPMDFWSFDRQIEDKN